MKHSREVREAVKADADYEALFSVIAYRQFAESMLAADTDGRAIHAATIIASMDVAEASALTAMMEEDAPQPDMERAARECMSKIKTYEREERYKELTDALLDTTLNAEQRAEIQRKQHKMLR
jgi:hypothetical protein